MGPSGQLRQGARCSMAHLGSIYQEVDTKKEDGYVQQGDRSRLHRLLSPISAHVTLSYHFFRARIS